MSDDYKDKLSEDIREFDRLMATEEEDDTRDVVVDDCAKFDVGGDKPDVDAAHDDIELVQLPVPDNKEKSKHMTA